MSRTSNLLKPPNETLGAPSLSSASKEKGMKILLKEKVMIDAKNGMLSDNAVLTYHNWGFASSGNMNKRIGNFSIRDSE
jgi:hypothetical protein